MPALSYSNPRISHTNHYAVVDVMPVFALLCTHIGYINHYAVVSVIPVLFYSDFIVISILRLLLIMACATCCMSAAESWSTNAS